jgi:formamidopyrimidine-DNA glycosylase
MDSRLVVGIGNIYAAESLHHAGISPLRTADRISRRATACWPMPSVDAGAASLPAAAVCATTCIATAVPAASSFPARSMTAPASPADLRRAGTGDSPGGPLDFYCPRCQR